MAVPALAMGSLPSTSNRQTHALTDMPMGQPEGPVPQLSFPLPRCVKFTTKANHDAPSLKSPNRILENFPLNKEHDRSYQLSINLTVLSTVV